MAFPLIPAVLIGGGALLLLGRAANGLSAWADVAGKARAGQPSAARRTVLNTTRVEPIAAAVRRLGLELTGKPLSVGMQFPELGYTVQPFQRANGEKTAIYHRDGAAKAFLVRGGFYQLYHGREKILGVPISDEFTIHRTRMGVRIPYRKQLFEHGRMEWYPGSNRLVAWGRTPLGRGRIYDSKPPVRDYPWYEDVGRYVAEEATLGDVIFAGVEAGAVLGTVGACLTVVGCIPAIGIALVMQTPAACNAKRRGEQLARELGKETQPGKTDGICKVTAKLASLANMASGVSSDSGEEGVEDADSGDEN